MIKKVFEVIKNTYVRFWCENVFILYFIIGYSLPVFLLLDYVGEISLTKFGLMICTIMLILALLVSASLIGLFIYLLTDIVNLVWVRLKAKKEFKPYGVSLYCGKQGQGKTIMMCELLKRMEEKKKWKFR